MGTLMLLASCGTFVTSNLDVLHQQPARNPDQQGSGYSSTARKVGGAVPGRSEHLVTGGHVGHLVADLVHDAEHLDAHALGQLAVQLALADLPISPG